MVAASIPCPVSRSPKQDRTFWPKLQFPRPRDLTHPTLRRFHHNSSRHCGIAPAHDRTIQEHLTRPVPDPLSPMTDHGLQASPPTSYLRQSRGSDLHGTIPRDRLVQILTFGLVALWLLLKPRQLCVRAAAALPLCESAPARCALLHPRS